MFPPFSFRPLDTSFSLIRTRSTGKQPRANRRIRRQSATTKKRTNQSTTSAHTETQDSTMAETNVALKSNEQLAQNLESVFASLNPPARGNRCETRPEIYSMERGCRYEAYSRLRESKLQQRKAETEAAKITPKKKVSFSGAPAGHRSEMPVVQSVPDFSAAIRKENKKPNSMLEMTPPAAAGKSAWRGGGSKSVGGGEKKGGAQLRKSYGSFKELKGYSAAAASAIEEEGRGKIGTRGGRKTVLGCRQYG